MPVAPEVLLEDMVATHLVGRYHGQTCMLTHHWKFAQRTVPEMTLDLEQVASFFLQEFWGGAASWYQGTMSSFFTCLGVTAQVIHPVRSIMWTAVPAVGQEPGLIIGASLPSGVAAVVRRRGNIGDRRNYGRNYIPALPVTFVSDSKLTQTAMNGLTLIAAKYETDIFVTGTGGDALFAPYLLHKADPTQSRRVTHGLVDTVVRYQRRREVGVGV